MPDKYRLNDKRDGVASAAIAYFDHSVVKTGNKNPVTASFGVGVGTSFDKWTYLMLDPANPLNVIPLAIAGDGKPLGKPVGLAVSPAAAVGSPTGVAVFIEYDINPEVVTWPASLDTYEKQATFHTQYGAPGIVFRRTAPIV